MKTLIKEHSGLVVIFCLCAVLRLVPLFNYQFTYDELSGLERTQFDSFAELLDKGVKIDAHPAFVQVLIYYTVKTFGYVTWIVKLPFLLFGFGALLYGYRIGLRHFSKSAGLIMASFLAFSLVFVFYAPIARMYISGVFFSLALLFYFFEIVSRPAALRHYVMFAVFALLSALNQHMNALFALTLYLAGLFVLERQKYKAYLLTGLLTALAYLPHLKISLYQLGVGGIGIEQGGWLDKPPLDAVLSFLRILTGTGNAGWFVFALVMLSAIQLRRYSLSKLQTLLLVVFLLNYFIIYLYSLFRAPIYQHSMMLFSGMAFLTLLGSLIEIRNKVWSGTAIAVLSAVLLYQSYINKRYFSQAVKTVFEYQFERTAFYKTRYGDANVYPVFFDADRIMKKIYFRKFATEFECKVPGDTALNSIHLFSDFVSKLTCNYLIVTSAMPAQQAVAQHYFPYLLENTQTQGINFKLYSKLESDKNKAVDNDAVLLTSNPDKPGAFVYTKAFDRQSGFQIDSLQEFPFDAYAPYHDVVKEEGQVVLLSARIKLIKAARGALEACVNIGHTASGETYGYASHAAFDFVRSKDSVATIYTDYYAGTNHPRVKPGSKIGCYMWNREKESAKLLSFEIKVIDYWPRKWHFWD